LESVKLILGGRFSQRNEPSGYHFFCRENGTHILVDEVAPVRALWSPVPRVLSIALTNACDLDCYFCYAPKHRARMDFQTVVALAREFDRLGGQEVVFGGGEPTLFPGFYDLIDAVHDTTRLAIGFTTHGHHLSPGRLKTGWQ
jgi:sulfatase maturation enzyme AslB (radical SAM superfamily)